MTTTTTTIENLLRRTKQAAEKRAAATQTEYAALVRSAAQGAELDHERLVAWLTENNFSAETFAADVQHLAARLSAAAAVAARPTAERKLAAADRDLEALRRSHAEKVAIEKAKFEAAVKQLADEHAEATAPALAEKGAVERTIKDAIEARAHLIETAAERFKDAIAGERNHIRAHEAEIVSLGEKLLVNERAVKARRPEVVAAATVRGEKSYKSEAEKYVPGEDHWAKHARAGEAVKVNIQRCIEEDIAKEEAMLQNIRNQIAVQEGYIAARRQRIAQIENEMLVA